MINELKTALQNPWDCQAHNVKAINDKHYLNLKRKTPANCNKPSW